MKLVFVESPYAGDVETNLTYARECLLDAIDRGEAPYGSHLLLPQVLDDTVPKERMIGIEIGLAWGAKADLTAMYVDLGVSMGMRYGETRAKEEGRPVEYRSISRKCMGILPSGEPCSHEVFASMRTIARLNWIQRSGSWRCVACRWRA